MFPEKKILTYPIPHTLKATGLEMEFNVRKVIEAEPATRDPLCLRLSRVRRKTDLKVWTRGKNGRRLCDYNNSCSCDLSMSNVYYYTIWMLF